MVLLYFQREVSCVQDLVSRILEPFLGVYGNLPYMNRLTRPQNPRHKITDTRYILLILFAYLLEPLRNSLLEAPARGPSYQGPPTESTL